MFLGQKTSLIYTQKDLGYTVFRFKVEKPNGRKYKHAL